MLKLANHPSVFAATRGRPEPHPLRLAVFGAMPNTGNLGVSALHTCLLEGIARRVPAPAITVFDDRRDKSCSTLSIAEGEFAYVRCPAIPTRRIYRTDSLWHIRAAGRLGGLGNEAIRVLRNADAVLDATAGDSFSDIYGARRFARALIEKRIVLEQHCPLILTPQTIGPFHDPAAARRATDVLRDASMVWARDRQSFETLGALLGSEFDPARHRRGVDLAFLLDARPPSTLSPTVRAWLETGATTVGINVSGLLMNDPDAAARRFGLRADYTACVTGLIERLLERHETNVLLVPHVFTAPGHVEHDPDACRSIEESIPANLRHRVHTLDVGNDPRHVKWVIRRLSWFCGTRMHASIAALSSGVPAAAIAYSFKTLGTFEMCGLADGVADPRALDTRAVIDHLWSSWTRRTATRAHLRPTLLRVRAEAEGQMDEITTCCLAARRARVTRTMPGRRAA